MEEKFLQTTRELIAFLDKSPTAFQAVDEIAAMLAENGFTHLSEAEEWSLVPGEKYYVTRNQSAIIAFVIPERYRRHFTICASHTDSPTFKLKANATGDGFGVYTKLNVENYGGMIYDSWFDRPLSVAGRVIVREENRMRAVPVVVDRDLVLIPHVAIHQMRNINSGVTYNPATDLCPLFGEKDAKLTPHLAKAAGLSEEQIVATDLYLYNRVPGTIWGDGDAFFSSARIDNLQCAYATLRGFLAGADPTGERGIAVYSSFDNEETGSATRQGAGSPFLLDTLNAICDALGVRLSTMLAASFMVSADNGHARHPNHPEMSDSANCPNLNGGVVIKANAAQKYATDGVSAAVFGEICRSAGVPTQVFHNRSDMPGGSTLGSISNTKVALHTVDIGLPQLAMHSAYETAGTKDTAYLIDAMTKFYETCFTSCGDDVIGME